jgi:hypothetical protein
MATPISTVNIALRTATVSRAGFGTPIFISSHRAFPERVRTYTSLTAVGEDFDTSSNAYIAATGFFSSTPSVAQIKIGRREADVVLTPTGVADGSVHSVTVTVNDGDAVTATFTAGAASTEEDVVDALKAAIDADADVSAHVNTTKTGTGASTTLTITTDTVNDVFSVSDVNNLSQSFTTSETAASVLQECSEEDNDFYFVTADDHSETFVLAMAAAVQATEKLYAVSTQENDSIATAYSAASTDILGQLMTSAFSRTFGFWSHDADTKFRECNYVGVNAPYSPDQRAVVWAQVALEGVPLALNGKGNALTGTEQKNLDDRKVNYVRSTLAGNRVEGGQTFTTWIDNRRTLDCMVARVRENQIALLANQGGGKVQGNAVGISLVRGALTKALNPFVASNAINGFEINIDNVTIDAGTRTMSGMSFDADLSGAIVRVVIDGDLVDQGV